MKINFSYQNVSKLFLTATFTFILISCRNEEEEKKNIRNKWYEYFFAFVETPVRIGTDSAFVNFQNHSPYKVDSALLVFHDKGLFVNSFDSLMVRNIAPGGSIKLRVPKHSFGVSKSVSFENIYSKELQFCFSANFHTKDRNRDPDPYRCK